MSMFWQKEIETMPRKELEALQLERLRWVVDYADHNVKFYHEKFKTIGVSADKMKQLSDVQYLPFTTKEDLRDHYPYGFCAVPYEKIIRIHASSGTTGKPVFGFYTKGDLENWANQVARLAIAVGVTQKDIAQISFGYGMYTGALGLHYGLEKIGCAIIPASSGNTVHKLMLMQDLGATVLVTSPSYAMYISEMAKETGADLSKLRIGLFGSEGCTIPFAERIEKNLGLIATDNYGLTELNGPGVSGDCMQRAGMHFAEDHFLPEIIDSDTLEVRSREEEGELVLTTLTKEGMPIIRYRTKDITRLHYEPCACGRTHARMEKVKGRSDDMMIIKGVNVFPSQIESVLIALNDVSANYQLIVRRDEKYRDSLEVKVESHNPGQISNDQAREYIQSIIKAKLREVLRLDVNVSLVLPGTLQRSEGKAKRVLDLREQAILSRC